MPDHYFTATPASDKDLRPLNVSLAGRSLTLSTARGVFSPDRVDHGTAVLLRLVPPPPSAGHVLDLGCGWGPLALTLALRAPAAHVWGVDVNERALELLRRNASDLELRNLTASLPEDVPGEVRFDALWSNPPIRVGKEVLHRMLQQWLPRLAPGAAAYLVVQRNLGSDSLQTWLGAQGWEASRFASDKGFRVLEVRAP